MGAVRTAVDDADLDPLATVADVAWRTVAIPHLVGADEGGTTIGVELVDTGRPHRLHARQLGDACRFVRTQLRCHAVERDAIAVADLERAPERAFDRAAMQLALGVEVGFVAVRSQGLAVEPLATRRIGCGARQTGHAAFIVEQARFHVSDDVDLAGRRLRGRGCIARLRERDDAAPQLHAAAHQCEPDRGGQAHQSKCLHDTPRNG